MATTALQFQSNAKFLSTFNQILSGKGLNGLISWSQAWVIAREHLKPRDIKDHAAMKPLHNIEEVRTAFSIIFTTKRLTALLEAFLEDIRMSFHLIEYEINEYMTRYEATENVELIRMLVARLMDWYKAWRPPTDLGTTVTCAFGLSFQTRLFAALPLSFGAGFKALCAGCLSPEDFPALENLDALSPTKDILWRECDALGLIDRYEVVIANVGYERIEKQILELCEGSWGKPMLAEIRNWMQEKVIPWLLLIYGRGLSSTQIASSVLQGIGQRFDYHINKVLCNLRIREIFDIIIDYPDSTGALQDLKECLHRVDQRGALVNALRKANAKRLLHPGADTKLILTQYVATIKCLRIVDPPGVLLYKVADPIRRYLRERRDTIRCIVASLVGDDESGDSLIDDNEPIQPLQQPESEDYNDPLWEPEPHDAGPEFKTNRPSDVISTLVSIYDSKDLFVRELQVLLAQRLLAITDADTRRVERERRNIEILKIRFGEAALQVCEVMLKDMTDSKRTDTHVQSQRASVVHPTIISHHFWPSLDSSDIAMPGQFQQLQEEYSRQFTVFKPDKKLRWLSHLGQVNLKLELENRTIEVTVPPLQAAFIELFSQKPVWTLEELIKGVGHVDRSWAAKALASLAVIHMVREQSENSFILLETWNEADEEAAAMGSSSSLALVGGDDCQPSSSSGGSAPGPSLPPAQTPQETEAEQMRMHWKYIEGMLTNLGSLSLERIQSMLKFVPHYDRSTEQLGMFMEAARREGMVISQNGMWKLNK